MHDMKTRSLDDLGRILDDDNATAAAQIRAATEVFRRHRLLQVEDELARLWKEWTRRGLHLKLVPPSPRPDSDEDD